VSLREFPVSHQGTTVSLRALCGDDPDASDSPARVAESLRRYLDEYCDRNGYTVESSRALEIAAAKPGSSNRVSLVATVKARYDGVWGSVRRALEEDGLLRPSDRADAPAGFWGDPVPTTTVTFGHETPSTPTVGDVWHDTRDDRMYVYGAAGWCEATVPESAFDSSLYEGTWTHDEICATPRMPASDRGWKTVGWVDGPAKAYANGDTITWTKTVTLTAD
jgi:hypothetical protein